MGSVVLSCSISIYPHCQRGRALTDTLGHFVLEGGMSVAASATAAPATAVQDTTIRVLLRVRPSRRPSGFFHAEGGALSFAVPSDVEREVSNAAGARCVAFAVGGVCR